ncbi:PQQ-dependent sugar dehydrogenase [Alkalilimnicola sp. S0819]|uniref:PQQ-dependent sugar dehydrogenase n=1 Tax=Alkalilimnicola sp. S0819 TaxID=2613922 RepID=UPI00126175C2|nr:PQQ-dependent sugar dehydrogenase [Alkalilimnicola sp. S0819]KAB7627677.1 PQQ-dependent sugar dehydrogenase [Alkalilimnicola sp. S0819]MPQ15844.1 PQQ-dependent sugar dehydrogenase [Alkalilimnicola sp. S0819]
MRLLATLLLCLGLADASARTLVSDAGTLRVERLASGLEHPWGLAFLADNRLLITERAGRMRIWSAREGLSEPVEGLPEIAVGGQGGLLDVAVEPAEPHPWVYFSYAEPRDGGASSTALSRARLANGRLTGLQHLFSQQPKVSGDKHFGGRIVLSGGDTLYLTTGERFRFDPAQRLDDHLGTIIRLRRDGGVPRDNPYIGRAGALPEIWSHGHRNILAAARHPTDHSLWVAEMGPRNGDELNRIEKGGNYGWPLVSWGEHYDGRDIPNPPTRPEFIGSALYWSPVIAPSGMIFYTGDAFPAWHGSALIGGLQSRGLVRVTIDGNRAREVERLALGARIRAVAEGPDGQVYLLTDAPRGELLRLGPN